MYTGSSGTISQLKFLCFTEVPGKERPPRRAAPLLSALPRRVAGLPAPPPTACEEGALLGRLDDRAARSKPKDDMREQKLNPKLANQP